MSPVNNLKYPFQLPVSVACMFVFQSSDITKGNILKRWFQGEGTRDLEFIMKGYNTVLAF